MEEFERYCLSVERKMVSKSCDLAKLIWIRLLPIYKENENLDIKHYLKSKPNDV